MTYPYQWFSAPKEISIVCPACQKEALFQFASVFHAEKNKTEYFLRLIPLLKRPLCMTLIPIPINFVSFFILP